MERKEKKNIMIGRGVVFVALAVLLFVLVVSADSSIYGDYKRSGEEFREHVKDQYEHRTNTENTEDPAPNTTSQDDMYLFFTVSIPSLSIFLSLILSKSLTLNLPLFLFLSLILSKSLTLNLPLFLFLYLYLLAVFLLFNSSRSRSAATKGQINYENKHP
jgi:hypothetical protein